jgi:TIR domain
VTADKDYFISYTGADQAWAEWIADTLERAGLGTVLQAWDFRPGENFIQRMNEALLKAERVLAVLSPAYLLRVRPRRMDRRTGPRPRPGRPAPARSDRRLHAAADHRQPHPRRSARPRRASGHQAAACGGGAAGRARPEGKLPFPGGHATAAALRFPGRRPTIFNVPPSNPNFTGRAELLQALRRRLAETSASAVVQTSAVHGLGGVGKTQLAIEYAHRFASDYDLVWWIPAEEPITIAVGWPSSPAGSACPPCLGLTSGSLPCSTSWRGGTAGC